jgi:hypothetical protein
LWGTEGDRQGYDANWLNSFATKAIEGLRWLFQLLAIVSHFFEGWQEKDFCLTVVINEDSVDIPSTIVSVCGNEANLMSSTENVMGIWDHLVWVTGPLTIISLTCQ